MKPSYTDSPRVKPKSESARRVKEAKLRDRTREVEAEIERVAQLFRDDEWDRGVADLIQLAKKMEAK